MIVFTLMIVRWCYYALRGMKKYANLVCGKKLCCGTITCDEISKSYLFGVFCIKSGRYAFLEQREYLIDHLNRRRNVTLSQKISSEPLLPDRITKYRECTICFEEFLPGQMVKDVPSCFHIFHSECLDMWLLQKFNCPNCNLEIKV